MGNAAEGQGMWLAEDVGLIAIIATAAAFGAVFGTRHS
jgi:hypothetical protein